MGGGSPLHNDRDLYYAFSLDEVLSRLTPDDGRIVGVALNLHESDAAPTAAADTGSVDRPAVIVSRGRVAGVVPPRSGLVHHRGGLESISSGADKEARAIEASAPPQVSIGDTVPLVVKLVSQGGASAVAITAAIDEEIDIVVQASGGLRVEGRTDGKLKVTASGQSMLLFKIGGNTIGPGEVAVLIFQSGQCVGSIDVAIETVAKVSNVSPASARTTLEPAPGRQPDLQLLVLESQSAGSLTYTMWFTTADPSLLNFQSFTFSLQQEPRAFFDKFYTEIEAILSSGATPAQKMQRLGAKGSYLFDQLLPPDARATLWSLRQRIQSVHVQSQEP